MVQRYDADTVAAKKRLRDKRQGVKDRRRELDLLAFRSNQGGAPLGCAQQLGQGLRFFLKRVLVRIESKGCRRALLCHVTSVISGTNPVKCNIWNQALHIARARTVRPWTRIPSFQPFAQAQSHVEEFV